VTPLLNGQQAIALCKTDRGLSQSPAHTRSRRDGVDAQAAGALPGHLVPDDPQDRELSRHRGDL
jgi:hypothetical protein